MQCNTTEEAKEIRRAYYRAYRKKHPDKVREANARYWQKKAREAAAEREASDGSGKDRA